MAFGRVHKGGVVYRPDTVSFIAANRRNPFDDDRRRCMIRPTGLGISGTRVHTLRYVSAVLRTNSDLGLLGLGFGTSTDCLCGRLTGRESPKVTADT